MGGHLSYVLKADEIVRKLLADLWARDGGHDFLRTVDGDGELQEAWRDIVLEEISQKLCNAMGCPFSWPAGVYTVTIGNDKDSIRWRLKEEPT